MALTVERIDRHYLATASPPHSDRPWTTPHPMRRGALKRALIARGAHVQDVVQLLDQVDAAHSAGDEARASF